jgi:hypothetical protein
MKGYLMPFRVMIHLLAYFEGPETSLLQMPEFLSVYYANGGNCYADSLNELHEITNRQLPGKAHCRPRYTKWLKAGCTCLCP